MIDIKKITQYRNIWMALGILWIVFFHSELKYDSSLLNYIKLIGYGGVDIFVFASGLGGYTSLSKNEDIYFFFAKRIKKIIPMYWMILAIWIIFKINTTGIIFYQIIGNVFCVQSFTGAGNDFNWYISAMWLYYMIIPVLFVSVNRMKYKILHLVILFLTIVLSLSFLNSFHLIIIMSRIPILFLGICVGKLVCEERKISRLQCAFLLVCSVIGFILIRVLFVNYEDKMWAYGLWWYPFILITPGLCVCISFLCMLLEKGKVGQRILKGLVAIGNHTLEIYLTHILIFDFFTYCSNKGYIWNCNRNWYILIVLVAVCSAILIMMRNVYKRIRSR